MATCKWCNKKGFFLFTDQDGLCKNCAFKIKSEANSKLRVLKNSEKLIEKTRNIDTLISNSELIIKYLSDFEIYEGKGINIFSVSIKEAISGSCKESDDKIFILIDQEFDKCIEKIKTIKSMNAKVNQASKLNNTFDKIKTYIQKRPIDNPTLIKKMSNLNEVLLLAAQDTNI